MPFITIISPNGGERLIVGNSYNFTWNSSGDFGNTNPFVYPWLEDTSGNIYYRFGFLESVNDGYERVEYLPYVPTGQYKLRLGGFISRGGNSIAVADVSDNYFTIYNNLNFRMDMESQIFMFFQVN